MGNKLQQLAEKLEKLSVEKRIEDIERDVKGILIKHIGKTNLCHYITKGLIELGYYKLEEGLIIFASSIKYDEYMQHEFEILLNAKLQDTIREIIDKVEDMIGGKMIAQALREIYGITKEN